MALSDEVSRQAEEERQYCLQKGRTMLGSPSAAAASPALQPPPAPQLPCVPPSPVSVASSEALDIPAGSPSVHPILASLPLEDSLRGAGAIFLTRYSRRNSSTALATTWQQEQQHLELMRQQQMMGPPCGARTSIPDREVCHHVPGARLLPACPCARPMRACCKNRPALFPLADVAPMPVRPIGQLTPGPGSYEPDTRRAMVSILSATADVPNPAFRSRTRRFVGHLNTFNSADPIHLFPGAERTRDTSKFAAASPTTFRRGKGHVTMATTE